MPEPTAMYSENLHAALWRSAAAGVLGGTAGRTADLDWAANPMLAGIDRHVRALENGLPVRPPRRAGTDHRDPDVIAYLSELQQRLVHSQLNDDPVLTAELRRQLKTFAHQDSALDQLGQKYFEYYAGYPYHQPGTPAYRCWQEPDAGNGDADFGLIEWRLPADATIAIVGDVGTGTDLAAATLVAALSFRPDAILHLGDVYYSGTTFEVEHRFVGLFESVFTATGHRAPVFGVPGNHEYFTGAHAYLAALDGAALQTRPDQRQQASYFALRSADDGWQFLGMDTGFYGHTVSMPIEAQRAALAVLHRRHPEIPLDPGSPAVTLSVPQPEMVRLRDDEVSWHTRHATSFPGRTVLLSHHQLYSARWEIGRAQRRLAVAGGGTRPDPADLNRVWIDTDLWRQVGPLFGHVAAWFWGHEHNLGIFADGYRPPGWPADLGADAAIFRTLPKGRCCGHAAIPVNIRDAPYARDFPVPLKRADLQLGRHGDWYHRGFQILNLRGAGKPMAARYFQVARLDPTPLLIHRETIA
ncbi:metallophosphoesterase [Mycobacterium sherrisii]|uniref:metallophosphoesterase n=1 Tax=Mycobacterium sherrisii TaxID=243061 RepID=UPI001150407C|nr:metallophosphoesterase [Mycobacterium sherrisii]MCV7030197.1 metallophosphoesterase [Mycobacterium sherrisii]MEC4765340.1 metallophosphoesterase [Mycobacterium sherrisii]